MNAPLRTIRDPRQSYGGGILTVHDLPRAGERKRWTPLYKAIIAAAIKNRLMSEQEACERYCMTAVELKLWIDRLESRGLPGLKANDFQHDYIVETFDNVPAIKAGPLSIDFVTQNVRFGDDVMHFTPNQIRLLSILIRRAPAAVTREDVYRLLYAGDRKPAAKILDVMICKIKKKLGADAIETVWGRGWRWTLIETKS